MIKGLIITFMTFSSAFGFAPIPREQAEDFVEQVYQDTKSIVDFHSSTQEAFVNIGHRAGLVDNYPKNVNGKQFRAEYMDINEMMDVSFNELGLSSIEIDVQLYKDNSSVSVQVVHDKIKSDKLTIQAKEYLERNTLESVLRHYFESGYYQQGKKLTIELKTALGAAFPHPKLNDDEILLMGLTGKWAKKIEEEYLTDNDFGSPYIFSGFNFYALQEVQKVTQKYDYFLIATSNRSWATPFISFFSGVLNSYLIAQIIQAQWLTGIWFNPFWIKNFGSFFKKLNDARKVPLQLIIPVYNTGSYKNFLKTLKDDAKKQKLSNVRGFVFDFK